MGSEVEIKIDKVKVKCRTPNGFGAMAGATRPNGSAEQHFLLSSERQWKPAPSPSRCSLGAMRVVQFSKKMLPVTWYKV